MSTTKASASVTVEQVARMCGVSPVTVSRAFRSDTSVGAATRKKILKAAEAAGYRPRVRLGRPRLPTALQRARVEVIFGGKLQTSFYSAILIAIECELAARKHDCVIRSANGEFQSFMQLCEALRADPETPTLLVGYLPTKQVQALLEARPQTLLVDHTGDPALSVPCASVGFDNAEAARMMTRHVLETGRRKILLINGFQGHYFSREFEQGHRDVLEQAGMPVNPALMLETDFSAKDATDKLNAVMDSGPAFDAIMTTDELAGPVLHTLHRRGIRVPEDVALAGCDGLDFGAYLTPPLTTLALDHVRLGHLAVAYILDSNWTWAAHLRTRLLPRLVIRESTLPAAVTPAQDRAPRPAPAAGAARAHAETLPTTPIEAAPQRFWRPPTSARPTDEPLSALDVYTPESLQKIRKQGVTAIWVRARLQGLIRSTLFSELNDAQAGNRVANLQGVIAAAKREGLSVFLHFHEPPALPSADPFWKRHPELKGARYREAGTGKGWNAFCPSTRPFRPLLAESVHHLFIDLQGLGGVVLEAGGEFLMHCPSVPGQARTGKTDTRRIACPRCNQRTLTDLVSERISVWASHAAAHSPEPRVWITDTTRATGADYPPVALIRALPHGVSMLIDADDGEARGEEEAEVFLGAFSRAHIGFCDLHTGTQASRPRKH